LYRISSLSLTDKGGADETKIFGFTGGAGICKREREGREFWLCATVFLHVAIVF
jgi:hypothetical protein